MATCVTAGRTRNCATAISGGSNFLYLTDKEDVSTVTVGVNDEITGITMVALTVFYKFQFAPDTASFVEAMTNENCATQVTQTYTMNWRGRNQTDRNSITELANCCCGMVAIHGENTGVSWLWGFDETEEVFLFSNDGTSGVAKSDPNEEIIVLQAISTKKAREFTPGEAGIPV
jgi:hypothetical protein